jgi:putative spermidine/putrescine transport system ATP-binding protein
LRPNPPINPIESRLMSQSFLSISAIDKAYGATVVVRDFNLEVRQGEFVSFLGPSGCGKTTMLRIIAGLEVPQQGTITIDGTDMTHLKPNQRNVGMVFQSYALFPNLTVAQNISFGLRVAHMGKAQISERVDEMLQIIKLAELGNRYPYQLSGGQQQRVALARALATKPRLLLLDEPLSALDAQVRVSLREEIRAIQRKLNITTIFVTHDQEEALSMSDRIVVMHNGMAEQVGTPFEIYNQPTTRFVANFVGTLNVLRGVVADPASGLVDFEKSRLALNRKLTTRGAEVFLALRPEAISLKADKDKTSSLQGEILDVSFLGSVIRVKVAVGNSMLSLDMFNSPGSAPPVVGEAATLHFAEGDVLLLGN